MQSPNNNAEKKDSSKSLDDYDKPLNSIIQRINLE